MRAEQYAYGVDSVQALIMALEGVRKTLGASGIEFQWATEEPGDTGFPRHVPMAFGLALSRRLDQLIDDETNRISEALALSAKRKRRAGD